MDWLFYLPLGAAAALCLWLPFVGRRRRHPRPRDFYGWATTQASLLREGKIGQVDAFFIAETLERAARAEQDRLDSALTSLMSLLRDPASDVSLVDRQRNRLQEVLQRNLSLLSGIEARIESAWRSVLDQSDQDGHPSPACPFTLNQLLDDRFICLEKEKPRKGHEGAIRGKG